MANENSNSLVSAMKVEYEVNGEKITLTQKIVKDLLVRGDQSKVTDSDIIEFMSLCKFGALNPFQGDAFLVKYGNAPAQKVTSSAAFTKRADESPNYDGIRSGIIVVRNGEVLDVEGSFKLPTDVLVGGWAEVHRKDRKYPHVARVSLEEYDKKQSTWLQIPCTMICKVAKTQALREAFPNRLENMYTPDEMPNYEDAQYEDVTNKTEGKANSKTLPDSKPSGTETQEQKPAAQPAGNQPQPGEMPDVFAQ